ncbi:MAG TPA: hypothetical protein VGJ87_18215, partial [Roseiflexaceae bacterium]
FDPAGDGQADPVDLRGGARARRRFIGWPTFFNFGDGNSRPNKRIDTKISTALFRLRLGAIPGTELSVTALPQSNLLRHLTWSIPSGQAIANAAGLPALGASNFTELRATMLAWMAVRRCGSTSSRRLNSWRTACALGRSAR